MCLITMISGVNRAILNIANSIPTAYRVQITTNIVMRLLFAGLKARRKQNDRLHNGTSARHGIRGQSYAVAYALL